MKHVALIVPIILTLFGATTYQNREQIQDHFRIDTIQVEGEKQFTLNGIIAISGLNQQSIASPEVLDMARNRLLRAYNNRGFIQAKVTVTAHFKAPVLGEMRSADVMLKIKEGAIFVLRRLEFIGNRASRDRIIRRRVLLNEGEPYNEDLLEASLQRINQLGLFVEISTRNVKKEVDEKGKTVDLLIQLTEKRKR